MVVVEHVSPSSWKTVSSTGIAALAAEAPKLLWAPEHRKLRVHRHDLPLTLLSRLIWLQLHLRSGGRCGPERWPDDKLQFVSCLPYMFLGSPVEFWVPLLRLARADELWVASRGVEEE